MKYILTALATLAITFSPTAKSDMNELCNYDSDMKQICTYDSDMNELYSYESHPEEWCLAQNIYYEARGSSYADQIAVADVVLNRMNDNRYPNTICTVVRQGSMNESKKNVCQFSWYCDGKSDWPQEKDSWVNAQTIAWQIIHNDMFRGITEGSTHYHADYVSPSWAPSLTLKGRIGLHVFYRWN